MVHSPNQKVGLASTSATGRPGEAAPSRPSLPSRFRGESPAFFAPPESPRCATWKMNENVMM